MTVHVIKAPAGLGKTSLIIKKIPSLPYQRVEIYVPTHALAEEIRTEVLKTGVTAQIIRGRDKELKPGQTMCKKPQLARMISSLGYPVFPTICMGPTNPGDKYTVKRCEHFDDCNYLKQFTSDARVLIFTHAYLPLPRNNAERIRPGLVVIDESFLSTCLQTYELRIDQLQPIASTDVVAACTCSTLLDLLAAGKPLLQELRALGVSAAVMREIRQEHFSSGASGFNPFESDDEFEKALKALKPRTRIDLLLEVLETELATRRSESHGVTYDLNAELVRVHYRKPITRFDFVKGAPKIVIIDANADPELIRPWFPDVHFDDLRASRNAYVVQCSSARGSKLTFAPHLSKKSADTKAWATRNLEGLQELVKNESEGGRKRVLVVGPQVVTGNSAKGVSALLDAPPNGQLAHFNGLRGVDAFKDFDTAIIVGRNQPGIEELEDLGRALWYDSPTPLRFADDFVTEDRAFRFRDPARRGGVTVQVHPDARIQRLHEQIRECESTQAIDRLRLIHTPIQKRVIVLSNIPLDLEVDELQDLQTLLQRTRLQRAWDRLRGVILLNPGWLSKTFPHLWPTPAAARTDLRAEAKSGHFFNSISIKGLTTFARYEYAVGGQRRRSAALSVLPLAQTLGELGRLLGVPVSLVDTSKPKPRLVHQAIFGRGSIEALQASGTICSSAASSTALPAPTSS